MKLLTCTFNYVELRKLLVFLDSVYVANDKAGNNENNKILYKWAKIILITYKTFMVLYVATVLLLLFYQIFQNVMFNKMECLLAAYIPGIDETTYNGFLITTCTHVTVIMCALVGLISGDGILMAILFHYYPLTLIFERSTQHLNDILVAKRPNKVHINITLRSILLMHKDIYM